MSDQLDQSDAKEAVKTSAPRRVMQRSSAPRAHPGPPAQHVHHERVHLEDDDHGFFAKHRTKLIIGVIVIAGAAFFFKPGKGSSPNGLPNT